jgi:uncharacterized membrane protein
MSVYDVLLSFFTYGFLGWCTEVAFAAVKEKKFVNRGFLNGPICPIYGMGVTAVVFFLAPVKENIIILYVASVLLVTVLEGFTGWLMEKIFHARWWDYTDMPLNIGGYVCLLFSLIWGVACVLIVDVIHPMFEKIFAMCPRFVGMIVLVFSLIAMFADVYVTAASILKMNRRLAAMGDIAEELHRISDEIGENIYTNVMEALERRDELKLKSKEFTDEVQERQDEIQDEIQERIRQLRDRYQEISDVFQKKHKRLLKAFPRMDTKDYREILEKMKKKMNR